MAIFGNKEESKPLRSGPLYTVKVSDTSDNTWEFEGVQNLPEVTTDGVARLKVVDEDGEVTFFNWQNVVSVSWKKSE